VHLCAYLAVKLRIFSNGEYSAMARYIFSCSLFGGGENSVVARYMQFTTFPERPAHPRTGRSTREREWADSRADQNSTINVCRRFGYLRTKKKIISLGTRKNLHTYSPCTYLLKQSYPTFPVNKSFLSTEDKHKLYSKQSPFTCMRLITLSGFK